MAMAEAGLEVVADPSRHVPGRSSSGRGRARSSCPPSRVVDRCWSRCRRSWPPPTPLNPAVRCTGVDPGRVGLLLAVLDRRVGLAVARARRVRHGRGRGTGHRARRRPGGRAGGGVLVVGPSRCRGDVVACGEVGLGGELRSVAGHRALGWPRRRASGSARRSCRGHPPEIDADIDVVRVDSIADASGCRSAPRPDDDTSAPTRTPSRRRSVPVGWLDGPAT